MLDKELLSVLNKVKESLLFLIKEESWELPFYNVGTKSACIPFYLPVGITSTVFKIAHKNIPLFYDMKFDMQPIEDISKVPAGKLEFPDSRYTTIEIRKL